MIDRIPDQCNYFAYKSVDNGITCGYFDPIDKVYYLVVEGKPRDSTFEEISKMEWDFIDWSIGK